MIIILPKCFNRRINLNEFDLNGHIALHELYFIVLDVIKNLSNIEISQGIRKNLYYLHDLQFKFLSTNHDMWTISLY